MITIDRPEVRNAIDHATATALADAFRAFDADKQRSACVLTGAVWADHCSPISDTTVLSSLATGCDHMDHVTTQIPYALTGGIVAILVGVLPAGYGIPWFLLLPTGFVVLIAVHRFLAKPVEA